MTMTLHQAKQEIVEAGRRLYDKGYIVSSDGNISARVSDDRIVATPTGLCKGTLGPDDLCILDTEGNQISGKLRPSSEIGMHYFLYRQRPDATAVVHAHPPTATAFSIANIPLTDCVLPEVIISLGSIPTARYGTPGGPEISEPIRQYVKEYDAYVLENHGATTIGNSVMNAYFKMETMEQFARILFIARQLGGVNVLDQEQIGKLVKIRDRLGIRGPDPACEVRRSSVAAVPNNGGGEIPTLRTRSAGGSVPPAVSRTKNEGAVEQNVVSEITRKVMDELRKQG